MTILIFPLNAWTCAHCICSLAHAWLHLNLNVHLGRNMKILVLNETYLVCFRYLYVFERPKNNNKKDSGHHRLSFYHNINLDALLNNSFWFLKKTFEFRFLWSISLLSLTQQSDVFKATWLIHNSIKSVSTFTHQLVVSVRLWNAEVNMLLETTRKDLYLNLIRSLW